MLNFLDASDFLATTFNHSGHYVTIYWRVCGFFMCRCEAFPTYPRTYDMVHADGLLTLEGSQRRCNTFDIFVEIDRILRPEVSKVVFFLKLFFIIFFHFKNDFCSPFCNKAANIRVYIGSGMGNFPRQSNRNRVNETACSTTQMGSSSYRNRE